MNLVLVESPTKAKTLGRFLGGEYGVEATYGHIRDLPQKKLGVDVDRDFKLDYVMTEKQEARAEEIKKLAHKAEKIYLATDPDREGEAIAWHVAEVIDDDRKLERIVFHEITQKAIGEALSHPQKVDKKLVDAQQARRVVDRLVGYKLSPLLWKKVRKGLSAGRVQSVAVRLVCEREREIEAFRPEEYWDIFVDVITQNTEGKSEIERAKFRVKLVEKNGEKLKVGNGEEAAGVEADLRKGEYQVAAVDRREAKRTPPPPFTTSTMQQAGANKLGWSAKKTMQVAQSLYEEGHITYHRTDSTNLAMEAVMAVKAYIYKTFGQDYVLDRPRFYKTKSKVAQEAHEAVRPTNAELAPGSMTGMNRDQEKLYDLIWKRFVACQMAEAVLLETKVGVTARVDAVMYGLEARGIVTKFDGWRRLYAVKAKKTEEEEGEEADGERELPELTASEKLKFVDLAADQKFTQPPARYTDASLIKTLEEMGIGRPSTYAPILSTIQERQYVERLEKRFKPTALGVAVNDFLVANFDQQLDYKFTARMEDDLDEIANGEKKWKEVVGDFYFPFEKHLVKVTENAARVKVEVETTGDKCPTCGEGDVVIRIGRFGRFLACSRYPDCKYKANYKDKIGIPCPKCGGDIIVRRTRSRKTFYGCSNYPTCDYASWTKPTAKKEEAVPEGKSETPVANG